LSGHVPTINRWRDAREFRRCSRERERQREREMEKAEWTITMSQVQDEIRSRKGDRKRDREREREREREKGTRHRRTPFHETQSERCNDYMRNTHTTKRNATAAIA